MPVDAEGLLWALHEFAHETSRLYGIACRVESDPDVAVPDNFSATQLYWIAREAVHNAVQHGRAHEITIRLVEKDQPRLSVVDDGTGLPAGTDESRTLGLRTMRFRSSVIGARFTIGPAPGGGTLVTCVCGAGSRS